jgi:L-fuconate dehydratase
MFKQLMQSNAIDFCQIDSCRLAGVNEVLAVMLMAAKFEIPVCPHAGGIGLCEYVQHLSIVDFICISGSIQDRIIEYVDALSEHFINPVKVKNGRYLLPFAIGYTVEIKKSSLNNYSFPSGVKWR